MSLGYLCVLYVALLERGPPVPWRSDGFRKTPGLAQGNRMGVLRNVCDSSGSRGREAWVLRRAVHDYVRGHPVRDELTSLEDDHQ
jgi:hypothetical protein